MHADDPQGAIVGTVGEGRGEREGRKEGGRISFASSYGGT